MEPVLRRKSFITSIACRFCRALLIILKRDGHREKVQNRWEKVQKFMSYFLLTGPLPARPGPCRASGKGQREGTGASVGWPPMSYQHNVCLARAHLLPFISSMACASCRAHLPLRAPHALAAPAAAQGAPTKEGTETRGHRGCSLRSVPSYCPCMSRANTVDLQYSYAFCVTAARNVAWPWQVSEEEHLLALCEPRPAPLPPAAKLILSHASTYFAAATPEREERASVLVARSAPQCGLA